MGKPIDIHRILEGGCLAQCARFEAFDFRANWYILFACQSDPTFLNDHVAGAVVASPTFSLPEYIGGVRNWCSPSSNR